MEVMRIVKEEIEMIRLEGLCKVLLPLRLIPMDYSQGEIANGCVQHHILTIRQKMIKYQNNNGDSNIVENCLEVIFFLVKKYDFHDDEKKITLASILEKIHEPFHKKFIYSWEQVISVT